MSTWCDPQMTPGGAKCRPLPQDPGLSYPPECPALFDPPFLTVGATGCGNARRIAHWANRASRTPDKTAVLPRLPPVEPARGRLRKISRRAAKAPGIAHRFGVQTRPAGKRALSELATLKHDRQAPRHPQAWTQRESSARQPPTPQPAPPAPKSRWRQVRVPSPKPSAQPPKSPASTPPKNSSPDASATLASPPAAVAIDTCAAAPTCRIEAPTARPLVPARSDPHARPPAKPSCHAADHPRQPASPASPPERPDSVSAAPPQPRPAYEQTSSNPYHANPWRSKAAPSDVRPGARRARPAPPKAEAPACRPAPTKPPPARQAPQRRLHQAALPPPGRRQTAAENGARICSMEVLNSARARWSAGGKFPAAVPWHKLQKAPLRGRTRS